MAETYRISVAIALANGVSPVLALPRCPLPGAKRKTYTPFELFRLCEGFRMPAP